MSDSSPGPLEWRQRHSDHYESMQKHLDGRQAQIHTSMPGHIVDFDPKKMTATVQPAIQAMEKQLDGTIKPMTIEAIRDVPMHFSAGGGYTTTFPIKKGDECVVTFHERSIDNWHQHGETQKPSDFRKHDINDASAHVAIRSQPNVLENFHAENAQMRSDDGKRYLEINNKDDQIRIIVGDTTITVDNKGESVEIVAKKEIKLTTPKVIISGVVEVMGQSSERAGGDVGTFHGTVRATEDVFSASVSGRYHVHTGVRAGPDTSGPPRP